MTPGLGVPKKNHVRGATWHQVKRFAPTRETFFRAKVTLDVPSESRYGSRRFSETMNVHDMSRHHLGPSPTTWPGAARAGLIALRSWRRNAEADSRLAPSLAALARLRFAMFIPLGPRQPDRRRDRWIARRQTPSTSTIISTSGSIRRTLMRRNGQSAKGGGEFEIRSSSPPRKTPTRTGTSQTDHIFKNHARRLRRPMFSGMANALPVLRAWRSALIIPSAMASPRLPDGQSRGQQRANPIPTRTANTAYLRAQVSELVTNYGPLSRCG